MEHGLQTTAVYWEGQMNSWRGVFGQAGCKSSSVFEVIYLPSIFQFFYSEAEPFRQPMARSGPGSWLTIESGRSGVFPS